MGFPSLDLPAIRLLSLARQWVLWRTEARDGKPTKVPLNPHNGYHASVTDPGAWGTLAEAYEATTKHECDGVGFVFSKKDSYVGVDLDKCITDGAVEPWAWEIVQRLNSYTEISPSGRGLHIIVSGSIKGTRRRKGRVEAYNHSRFFTITGDVPNGCADDVREAGDVSWVLDTEGAKVEQKAARAKGQRAIKDESADYAKLVNELEPFVDEAAAPPIDKLEVLWENAPVTRETWDRTRTDVKEWTASEYDLALANFFMSAGWTDVEIMVGLLACRRVHGDDLKITRTPHCDYYVRTILAARRNRERSEAQEAISQEALSQIDPAQKRVYVLDALTRIYGVAISRIVKYLGDPPTFVLTTTRGAVSGPIDVLMNQQNLRKAFAETAHVVVPKAKGPHHDERVQAMLDVAEEEEIGDEATNVGQAESWIRRFLEQSPPASRVFEPQHALNGFPFIWDHQLWIPGAPFRQWIKTTFQERVEGRRLGAMMRMAGSAPKAITVTVDGKKTSVNAWQVPVGLGQ